VDLVLDLVVDVDFDLDFDLDLDLLMVGSLNGRARFAITRTPVRAERSARATGAKSKHALGTHDALRLRLP